MPEFQPVAKVEEIKEGCGGSFRVGDRMVALFLKDGKYYAMDDFCPHMGASLGAGEIQDDKVVCPWHAWRFCFTDGTWCDNPAVSVDTFEVRLSGNQIEVKIPEA